MGGIRRTYSFLKRIPQEFAGISTDFQSHRVSYVDRTARDVKAYDADAFPPAFPLNTTFPSLPAISGRDGVPGGIAQDIFWNTIWVGDQANRTLYTSTTLTPSWNQLPCPGLGVPTGVAGDAYANTIWIGDSTNHGIRPYYTASSNCETLVQLPGGIGEPAGIATDYYGNIVWVANITTRTIQVYTIATDSWQALGNPGFNGAPRGLAVTSDGGWVWVTDDASLRGYNYDCACWDFNTPLPPGVTNNQTNRVLGLATDGFGSLVWLHTKNNEIWALTSLTPPVFQRALPP